MKYQRKTTFPAFLSTFILCALFWLMLTGSFAVEELIVGALVSAVVAFFSAKFLIHDSALWLLHPGRFLTLLFYCIIIFPWELIKANVDVALRALSPSLPINPGIVKVPVGLKSAYGRTMLSDSITLTPGTITMEMAEEGEQLYYYIHWIDVKETDSVKAGEAIKGTLEKWVGRIWK
ncbi:MAG: Na+/H+ antiporter subunit E [Oscillospiraceae bacterium]